MVFHTYVLIALIGYVNSQFPSCSPSNGTPGNCIIIHDCPYVKNLVKAPISNENKIKAAKLQCGWESTVPKVCCPPEIEQNITSRQSNVGLFDRENCGDLMLIDKIINGNATALFEFPWMALLGYRSEGRFSWSCGGTLINENYILTAAHCINRRLVRVRLGEHNLDTEEDCTYVDDVKECAKPYQDFNINNTNVVVHKKYPPYSVFNPRIINDIALIRLPRPAQLSKSVKPICLPFDPAFKGKIFDKQLTVSGWGKTENKSSSDILLKADVPQRTIKDCIPAYSTPSVKAFITNDYHLCAGGLDKSDSCKGDSGGPLQVIENLQYVQVGIVSFGPKFCGTNTPGVYTNLANYVDWILDNVSP